MTGETGKISGYMLLSVPTIIYGRYFLFTVSGGKQEHLQLANFQKSMFRAGQAHSGVLVIRALVTQLIADHVSLSRRWKRFVQIAFPISAITTWLIPFLVAFAMNSIHEKNRPLLENKINIIAIGTVIFSVSYFKELKKNYIKEGVLQANRWVPMVV